MLLMTGVHALLIVPFRVSVVFLSLLPAQLCSSFPVALSVKQVRFPRLFGIVAFPIASLSGCINTSLLAPSVVVIAATLGACLSSFFHSRHARCGSAFLRFRLSSGWKMGCWGCLPAFATQTGQCAPVGCWGSAQLE